MKNKTKQYFEIEKNNDTRYLTILSVVACIIVVFMHCNDTIWNFEKTPSWILSMIMHSIASFGVPIFFMVSGATLLNYKTRYNTKTYFIKRIQKVLIPYIFWTLVYIGFNVGTGLVKPSDITFQYFWEGIVFGLKINENFWFFPSLILIYLIIPIFASLKDETRDKICLYVVILGLLNIFIIPMIIDLSGFQVGWFYSIPVLYPLVYTCTGYLLKNYKLNKKINITIIVLGILAFIGMSLFSWFKSCELGKRNTDMVNYGWITVYLYSIAIFVSIKALSMRTNKKSKSNKIWSFAGTFTFPIYLTHKMIRIVFWQYILNPNGIINYQSYVYRFVGPLFIFAVIVTSVYLLRKIPYVNKGIKWILP